MLEKLKVTYQKIVNAGIDESTPLPLIDRVVFSNMICIIVSGINIAFALVNIVLGYPILLLMNMMYQSAMVACVYLNFRKKHLLARVILLSLLYLGIFLSSALQGPQNEIEHFFIPFGVLAFSLFYAEERRYSIGFLLVAIGAYTLLVFQSEPLLSIDPAADKYSKVDLIANRIGYLGIFFVSLFSLSNAFNRALRIIDDQRTKIYEEGRVAFMGTMASNVAHEINSPLTALDLQLFQLDLLLKRGVLTNVEVQERVDKMSKISRRISVIVRGLKFLSRPDDNDPKVLRSLQALIDSAIDLNRERIEKYQIRIKQKLEDPQIEVHGRPVALSQVFLNLINNSIDAIKNLPPGDRWIEIVSKSTGTQIMVAVEDGGIISSSEVRDNLFKNFFTTKPPGKGTGLGLSISKETVEGHGGRLFYDSSNTCTRFVVELPYDSTMGSDNSSVSS